MPDKVAVVTGSNKGIGYAVVKKLCMEFEGIVYMTARNQQLGNEALESLNKSLTNKKCKSLNFHALDITKRDTIVALKDHLLAKHGGLDVLVNNAAIAYKNADTTPFAEQAEKTIQTNYFGTKMVCEILFPILRPHARVVNISSTAGLLQQVTSEDLRAKFSSKDLTVEQLDNLVTKFVEFAKNDQHKANGYSGSAYGMSKVAVTALTFIQQKQFDKDSRPDLVVNACCPGYVDTDMTSHKGHLTPEQGAETPSYLALLPADVKRPRGAFVSKMKETNWVTGEPINF